MQRHKDNILEKMLQITIIIIVFGFATSTVFGQMGPTTYSDLWADESGYLYGCGSTDEGANNFGHEPGARSTLRSPNGRVSSYDSGIGSGVAFVSLPFDPNDLGNFFLSTEHYDYCPVANTILNYGSTNASTTAGCGSSISWWHRDLPPREGNCNYSPLADCNVECKPSNPWNRRCDWEWIKAYRPWTSIAGIKICSGLGIGDEADYGYIYFPTDGTGVCKEDVVCTPF
jgi:hypothetical protein